MRLYAFGKIEVSERCLRKHRPDSPQERAGNLFAVSESHIGGVPFGFDAG